MVGPDSVMYKTKVHKHNGKDLAQGELKVHAHREAFGTIELPAHPEKERDDKDAALVEKKKRGGEFHVVRVEVFCDEHDADGRRSVKNHYKWDNHNIYSKKMHFLMTFDIRKSMIKDY